MTYIELWRLRVYGGKYEENDKILTMNIKSWMKGGYVSLESYWVGVWKIILSGVAGWCGRRSALCPSRY